MKRTTSAAVAPAPSRFRTALAAAALLAVLFPTALRGQDERIDTPYRWIERGGRVGVYAGYVFADRGDLQLGPGPTATFGTRLRTRVSSPLSLELTLGFGSSDRYVIDPRLETGPAPVDTVALDWLLAQVGLQLSLTGARSYHRFQPYVLFTGGIQWGMNEERSDYFNPTESEFRYSLGTAAAIGLGLGTEIDMSDRFRIGVEIRDYLWRIKTPDGFFRLDVLEGIAEAGAVAPRESQWTHNLELSGALHFYF